jgi:hypothetical protein
MTVVLAVAFGLAFYGAALSLAREVHAWLGRRSPIDRLNFEMARARARRRR